MSGTIFLAGILQFQSRALFEEALEAIRTEETYSEKSSLVPIFQASMLNDGLMVLRHNSTFPANHYDRLMAEAYLLSEFAGRGYIAGILRDTNPKVQVAMAAMSHPVIDVFKPKPDPALETDYFPRLENMRLAYAYRSEGREEIIEWTSRPSQFGPFHYISFPQDGSKDPFNDWWDGHYYLKSGHQWFGVATDLDAQALSEPAEEEIQLILDGNSSPGQTYFSYVPGTENFRLYTHEGFEDLDSPIGELNRCMKVRVDLYFLSADEKSYNSVESEKAFKKVTTTHYFAKGMGLVKLVFEDGELLLQKMEIGEIPLSSNPEVQLNPQSQNATTSSDHNGRKPWWKFW